MTFHVQSPYEVSGSGRTASASDEFYLRSLIEAVIFTIPGERLNRPDFGCGITELLFFGVESAVETTLEMTVAAGLQRWLGELITVEDIEVLATETEIQVEVTYSERSTAITHTDTFKKRA